MDDTNANLSIAKTKQNILLFLRQINDQMEDTGFILEIPFDTYALDLKELNNIRFRVMRKIYIKQLTTEIPEEIPIETIEKLQQQGFGMQFDLKRLNPAQKKKAIIDMLEEKNEFQQKIYESMKDNIQWLAKCALVESTGMPEKNADLWTTTLRVIHDSSPTEKCLEIVTNK